MTNPWMDVLVPDIRRKIMSCDGITSWEHWVMTVVSRGLCDEQWRPFRPRGPRFTIPAAEHMYIRADSDLAPPWSRGALAWDPHSRWLGVLLSSRDDGLVSETARILITHVFHGAEPLLWDEPPYHCGQERLRFFSSFFVFGHPAPETHSQVYVAEALYTASVYKGYNNRPAPVLSPALRVCLFLARHGGSYPYPSCVGLVAITYSWTPDEVKAVFHDLRDRGYVSHDKGATMRLRRQALSH
jgi:hypothetical protein